MAPVLIPKIFSELYPVKKLPLNCLVVCGACLEESVVLCCFSFDKGFSLLPCMGYDYSCFPHSWFLVSWKWLLCLVAWRATASPHLWGWNDWVVSLNEQLSPHSGSFHCKDPASCSGTLLSPSNRGSCETCEWKMRGSCASPHCRALTLGSALWQSGGKMQVSVSDWCFPMVSVLQRVLCHRHTQATPWGKAG